MLRLTIGRLLFFILVVVDHPLGCHGIWSLTMNQPIPLTTKGPPRYLVFTFILLIEPSNKERLGR